MTASTSNFSFEPRSGQINTTKTSFVNIKHNILCVYNFLYWQHLALKLDKIEGNS